MNETGIKEMKKAKGIKAVKEAMRANRIKTKAAKWIKTSKTAKAGAAAGVLCLFAASGIHNGYAYFSGTSEMKANQISIAGGEQDQRGALTVIEPEWDARKAADENYAMGMQPGESVVKDPRVESSLGYPCWVFVEVSVPENWGTLRKEDNPYEYVTFVGDGMDYTHQFEIVVPEVNQEDWKLYQRMRGKNMTEYVYGYRIPLEAHGVTSPLFESIAVPEFKQFEGTETYILIRAQAVQTEGCPTLDDAAEKLGIETKIEQTTIKP